jgi:hypothetical protein
MMRRLLLTIVAAGAIQLSGSRTDTTNSAVTTKNSLTGCPYRSADLNANGQIFLKVATPPDAAKDDEPKGCCCFLKDSGPPLVWDCTGYKDDTLVTQTQCKKDADELVSKFKWHEGKCTDKD